jgi:hypothetical protein
MRSSPDTNISERNSSVHYFGFKNAGHLLYTPVGREIYDPIGIPWSPSLMDTGLLKNGKRPDVYDGKVFSVPAANMWIAFFWWDRSGDHRPGSNSGFYVHGFEWEERKAAFKYACSKFAEIIKRQKFPLVLREQP